MLTPLQQSFSNCKELDFPDGSGSEASTARDMGSIPGQGTKSPHAIQLSQLLSKSLQAINAGEGVEKREPSYTVGRNAN